jgi:glucan biosynthesis protein C
LALIIFRNTSGGNGMLEKIFHFYTKDLISWIILNYCFCFFYRFLNHNSLILKFLSNASYTIYLFHHIIVIILGYYLIQFNMAPIMKAGIILIITLFITAIIHIKIVNRYRPVQFLFNGK